VFQESLPTRSPPFAFGQRPAHRQFITAFGRQARTGASDQFSLTKLATSQRRWQTRSSDTTCAITARRICESWPGCSRPARIHRQSGAASYGANRLGLEVGKCVHINLGQADEEYVEGPRDRFRQPNVHGDLHGGSRRRRHRPPDHLAHAGPQRRRPPRLRHPRRRLTRSRLRPDRGDPDLSAFSIAWGH
jgi:hypothetical protein